MTDLPSYFLADLPPEAELTSTLITEACQALRRNRQRYLAARSTAEIIGIISRVAEVWLDDQSLWRKAALEHGPVQAGFSAPTLGTGLDSFFGQLTAANLERLVLQELGHMERLDQLSSSELESKENRASLAWGPELLVHIAAGNLPSPVLMSMVLGLLVRSAQFVKCASGTALLPRLFAHSIYEEDRKLGACIEVAEWKGGAQTLETALFAETECVTATGGDETLERIERRLPGHVRFLGYGHRVSFGFVAREVLAGGSATETVRQAARDITSWNQLGCLSPHVVYVESGGLVSPEKFAELLSGELETLEGKEPRGPLPPEEAAAIATRRAFYEIRAAHSPDTRMWCSADSTAWTVVYENDPQFQASCLNRFIYVKPAANLGEVLKAVDPFHGKISTVGLAAGGRRKFELANQIARWGVTRICPMGQMQKPPLTWRHDGRPSLADLITWTDWEF